jgi:hypothetical protein
VLAITKFLVVVLMVASVRWLFGVRRADGRSDPRSCLCRPVRLIGALNELALVSCNGCSMTRICGGGVWLCRDDGVVTAATVDSETT